MAKAAEVRSRAENEEETRPQRKNGRNSTERNPIGSRREKSAPGNRRDPWTRQTGRPARKDVRNVRMRCEPRRETEIPEKHRRPESIPPDPIRIADDIAVPVSGRTAESQTAVRRNKQIKKVGWPHRTDETTSLFLTAPEARDRTQAIVRTRRLPQ